MKKIFSEIYKKDYNLKKYWWYRLVRVCSLTLFGLIILAIMIVLMVEPPVELLGKHNTYIKNSIYSFTENFQGKDYINTLPKFIEEDGQFGILNKNKLINKTSYLSMYDLGSRSFCIKDVEKYADGIALKFSTEDKVPIEEVKKFMEKDKIENPDRKCYFIGTQFEELGLENGVSKSYVNFRPNIIYYIEVVLLVLLGAFIFFTILSLIYWGPVRYVIYGKKSRDHHKNEISSDDVK